MLTVGGQKDVTQDRGISVTQKRQRHVHVDYRGDESLSVGIHMSAGDGACVNETGSHASRAWPSAH